MLLLLSRDRMLRLCFRQFHAPQYAGWWPQQKFPYGRSISAWSALKTLWPLGAGYWRPVRLERLAFLRTSEFQSPQLNDGYKSIEYPDRNLWSNLGHCVITIAAKSSDSNLMSAVFQMLQLERGFHSQVFLFREKFLRHFEFRFLSSK